MQVRIWMVIGVALWSGCFPTDPGCEFEEPCPEGQVRQCINFCVPVATVTEADSGEAFCALDPCADLGSVVRVCPDGYFCSPTSGGGALLGRCQPDGPDFGDVCGGRIGDVHPACAQDTFCMRAECGRAQAWTQLTGLATDDGFCLDAVREGGLCDSNWLDARANPRTGFEGGCAPCEAGTVCAPSEDGERRCIRLCEQNALGVVTPEPELCACQGQTCDDRGETFDPETGERLGRFFCSECTINRTEECETPDDCCDPQATCRSYLDSRNVPKRDCCRDVGFGCDPSGTRECCGDTYCDPGTSTCLPCARLGEALANAPCCPGLEPVVMVEGQSPVCQACGFFDDKFLCSQQSLVIRGEEQVESVPIPNTNLSYREVVGHVSGDLDVTRDDVRQVEWNLTDDHRAFFFDTRLSNGVRVGDEYFSLPFNDPAGVPRTELVPDPSSWRSVRVYDAGDCSLLLEWGQLAGILGTEINKALLDGLFDDLDVEFERLSFVEVTPQLRASPRYPIEFPLGPEDAADRIRIRLRGQISPILLDCGELTLDIEAEVRAEPAIEPTSPLDTTIASVGCALSDDVLDPEYICMLPVAPVGADDTWTVQRFVIPPLTFDQFQAATCRAECVSSTCGFLPPEEVLACEDECRRDCNDRGPIEFPLDAFSRRRNDVFVTGARCFQTRDEYRCVHIPNLRRSDEGIDGLYQNNIINSRIFTVPRQVTTIDGATDIVLRPTRPNIDIDDSRRECRFQDAIARGFEFDVEAAVWEFATDITEILSGAIGSGASTDFGVPLAEVRECSTNDDCDGYFGGVRHRCTGGRCEQLFIEPRRIAVRPDGFEIILAEDPRDPQRPLIAGSVVGFRACAPGRSSSRTGVEFTAGLEPRVLDAERAEFAAPYCENDEVGCTGICADLGAECGGRAYERLTSIPTEIPSDARCTLGQCCSPDNVCDGQCRDVDTDVEHCGGCDVLCAAGQACAAGICCAANAVCAGMCRDLDTDPDHCGRCGGRCAEGDICCSGGCKAIARDPENCGGCGVACDVGEVCASAACCDPGSVCDGTCRNLQTDINNCGGCGIACPGALPICVDGECFVGSP